MADPATMAKIVTDLKRQKELTHARHLLLIFTAGPDADADADGGWPRFTY